MTIKVAILEDCQCIIDGYRYSLNESSDIEVVGTAAFSEDLDQILENQPVDVLIMDINVPSQHVNPNPFPASHFIPHIIQDFPDISILVISTFTQSTLIQALVDLGISGFIIKHDSESIRQLSRIVTMIANPGIFFSKEAFNKLRMDKAGQINQTLTTRQFEALSLCAAYSNISTAAIANKMKIANSTLRNLLSGAYRSLHVHTRRAAVTRILQLCVTVTSSLDEAS